MSDFIVKKTLGNHHITATVGIISPTNMPDKFVAIKNKRGWDIPGGHVQNKENPLQTFSREFYEETGCTLLDNAYVIAVLISKRNPHTGIVVYTGTCKIGIFTPTNEIQTSKFVSKEQLLNIYFGDKLILHQLLDLATIKIK